MQFGNYWSGPAHNLIGGGTWASKAGGGTGGRFPRSLKISGGRPSRNDNISVSFFSVLGISLYRANLEAFLINYHRYCQNHPFECRKIKLPIRVRKYNPARWWLQNCALNYKNKVTKVCCLVTSDLRLIRWRYQCRANIRHFLTVLWVGLPVHLAFYRVSFVRVVSDYVNLFKLWAAAVFYIGD